jgi:hypothetical protein
MWLSLLEDKFDDAKTYIERAKTHIASSEHYRGLVMEGQAVIWYLQDRLEDATSEALAALKIYKELGASENAKNSERLLQTIEQARSGELLETILPSSYVHLPPSAFLTSSNTSANAPGRRPHI